MIPFFLASRFARIGRRPVADPSVKASIRESLVRAGYLPPRNLFLVRFRVVLASVALLITGLGGMASYAYAADAVLPNTPLYPVRQKMEALERRLSPTPAIRAKVVEKQLQRRKKEAHLLEVLHKPLPPLHAKLLQEEREKGRVKDRGEEQNSKESEKDASKKNRSMRKEERQEKRPRDRS